jgi:glycerol uptake facilitator-like aquaporin
MVVIALFIIQQLLQPPPSTAQTNRPTMPAITILSKIYHKIAPIFPPGLATSLAASYIGDGKFFKAWRHEFIGTLLMIGLTFTPGKWIGQDSIAIAWAAHACGVIAADKIGGGPHVNPAVTCSMYALGKCSYTEAFVRIMGAMGGGLVAFPLYKLVADTMNLTPLGGPEFDPTNDADGIHAAFSEAVAVVLLMLLIYTVNWELNFGKYHYWIKQTLTALGIRYIIQTFPLAGPSINPMLATTVSYP